MALWQLFEKISPPATPSKMHKAPLVVPTIVVTPVLEEQKKTTPYDDNDDFFGQGFSLKAFEATVEVSTNEVLPTPPTSPPADKAVLDATGLGISGVEVQVKADYSDPLNEVDDLLEILGLSVEVERDEIEDEVERLLEAMGEQASKLVNKSKAQFLELSREWHELAQREYLPAKQEAKLVIAKSDAMVGYRKSWTWSITASSGTKQREKMSREDRLFSAIVLADSAGPACQAAFEAVEKIHNLQTIALSKYATRLKDHKILPLVTYRRYVRRVKRTEREMEGWMRKKGACGRILEVGERMISELGKEPGSPDSGYEE